MVISPKTVRLALAGVTMSALLAACGASVETPGDASRSGDDAGSSGAPVALCVYVDTPCGGSGEVPACSACTAFPADQPTCGCDGKVHASPCEAAAVGALQGSCETPPGRFDCGPFFCAAGAEYCRVDIAPDWMSQSFRCVAIPPACGGTPGCDCLPTAPCPGSCGGTCGGAADAGFQVVCCD